MIYLLCSTQYAQYLNILTGLRFKYYSLPTWTGKCWVRMWNWDWWLQRLGSWGHFGGFQLGAEEPNPWRGISINGSSTWRSGNWEITLEYNIILGFLHLDVSDSHNRAVKLTPSSLTTFSIRDMNRTSLLNRTSSMHWWRR